MMSRFGSSDASFAPASMASFSALGGGDGSEKEKLWDSGYAASHQSHLFFHQNPTLEDMDAQIPFSPLLGYPYPPQESFFARKEAAAAACGHPATSHLPPHCQAEGCNSDLSSAKHYDRHHKVCNSHPEATVIIIAHVCSIDSASNAAGSMCLQSLMRPREAAGSARPTTIAGGESLISYHQQQQPQRNTTQTAQAP
ncbi:hypothetical protein ZIOFF_070163 [Zingiber officinale]|uniref:SBP-type domain-containing protein n=1 Tax=Zingiber officinale TaxID=94328 RepID=A0A8J5EUE2_ZINOF|nr:hypothetical protein ZIOFF_070163 [Zingiber officinale]